MDEIEKDTYRQHRRAFLFEGVLNSLIAAAPAIAVRNLHATPFDVMLITMAPGVAQLVSFFFAGAFDAIDRRKLILYPALFGRLPLAFLLLAGDLWLFIALLMWQAIMVVPITAGWNSLLRVNYTNETRGSLYGRAVRYGHLSSALIALALGLWLDENPRAFQYAYPTAAAAGVMACWLFTRIPLRPGAPSAVRAPRFDVLYAVRVLSADSAFFRYQVGFFFYGTAFMVIMIAKPLYATHVLDASNTVQLGANALWGIAIVLFTPYMGRVMDRSNPATLTAISFALLVLHSLVLCFATTTAIYLVAESIFGVAMAGVLISWNMGPVAFAGPGEAGRYTGVHAALVGVRALLGHPLGFAITNYAPYWTAFPVALVFFLVATIVMIRLRPAMHERLAAERLASREAELRAIAVAERIGDGAGEVDLGETRPKTPDAAPSLAGGSQEKPCS
ncbi:MAG: MFS transporter [Planctomycetes bacterium]|nr:MFS transporter [Planctomycetota bacterium]